jgi:mono/diheme cytochrome c family protein
MRDLRIAGYWVLFALSGLAAAGWAAAHAKSDWQAPPEAKNMKNPVPSNEATLAAGKVLYTDKCASCHGDTGDGKGPEAEMYAVSPADFRDFNLMSEMTDGELFWKITEGRRPMPSFKKQFADEQRWQLVNYIRTFAKPPASAASPAKHPPHKK